MQGRLAEVLSKIVSLNNANICKQICMLWNTKYPLLCTSRKCVVNRTKHWSKEKAELQYIKKIWKLIVQ